jgi:bleomycin hydrolase
MGNAASTPQLQPPRERRLHRESTLVTTLDEKLDLLKIDHGTEEPLEHAIFTSGNSEHVDAVATERYVRQLLKDPKNRLGLSALSTNNPSIVLEKPSAIIKDTQFFNLKIPHEGSPVSPPPKPPLKTTY